MSDEAPNDDTSKKSRNENTYYVKVSIPFEPPSIKNEVDKALDAFNKTKDNRRKIGPSCCYGANGKSEVYLYRVGSQEIADAMHISLRSLGAEVSYASHGSRKGFLDSLDEYFGFPPLSARSS